MAEKPRQMGASALTPMEFPVLQEISPIIFSSQGRQLTSTSFSRRKKMATDYISRDALLRERHACTRDCTTCDFAIDGDSWCEGELFVVDVLRIPTADVVQRKRGHWIVPVPGDGEPYCSECKKEAPTVGAFNMHSELTDFCPHCGADMREDNNG